MRVCLLSYRSNAYCGGQGIYLYYLSRELCNLGHDVQVISGPPYPVLDDGIPLHKLESLNLYERRGPWWRVVPRLGDPINLCEFVGTGLGTFSEPLTFSLRAHGKIRQLAPAHRFDIIHDNQGLGYGLLLMKRLKTPLVATIHHPITIDREMELAQARNWWEGVKLRRWYSLYTMQGRVARRLDRVITVSQSSAKAIEHAFRVPGSKLRVVYNGVDLDLFSKRDGVARVPRSLILVNSGEQSIKGVTYLLKALHLLRGEIELKLTIVGSPKPDGHCLRLIRDYQLDGIVGFTGRVSMDELVKHYLASEICVVPSLYEGFGFPAAEAMACELPVISTTAGALPEVVGADGEAGILVPPADAYALARAIKLLLSDEALRRKMGQAGRKRMEKNFTWREAARKTVEVYQEVLNAHY